MMALAILSASSCEDFLQEDPTEQPSQSSFWLRASDFQQALAGCYSYFYKSPGVMSNMMIVYDALSDNGISQGDDGGAKNMAIGNIYPETGGWIKDIYTQEYAMITRINALMEHTEAYEGGDMSADDKKFILAQCHALRAYCYGWLYRLYREVPLVTHTLTLDNMYQPKTDRSEIKAQIIKDWDEAIANLPDKLYSDSSVSGRFTVAAAKAFKAQFLMFDGYDDNGNAISSVMSEVLPLLDAVKGYKLADRMRDNFISAKQLECPEIIFSIRYLAPNLTNYLDRHWGWWQAIQPTRDVVDAFECTDGLPWNESPLAVHPNEELLKGTGRAYTEDLVAEREKIFQNRDSRLLQTMYHSNIGLFTEPGYDEPMPEWVSATVTGFTFTKLVQPTKAKIDYSTISDADVVLMRYAYVLLMIAEAENELNGPTQKALDAVNAVRTRSGQPAIQSGISKDKLRERIRNEWRVETCFEGLRYFQMKQWKILDKVNGMEDPAMPGYIKVYKPAFEYWPLPQSEIDKANGVLVQDPNYK